MKEKINAYFNRYSSFSNEEIDQFYKKTRLKSYANKEFLTKEGQVCSYNYFILEGLVRLLYLHDGFEHTVQFAIENWWVTSIESFIKGTPSSVSIQALEPTVVLAIHKNSLEEIYNSNPRFERAFRMVTENMLIALQRKSDFFMKKSSEERYENLTKGIPNLIQRVPQYMIASYLSMTPEHLSALKKRR